MGNYASTWKSENVIFYEKKWTHYLNVNISFSYFRVIEFNIKSDLWISKYLITLKFKDYYLIFMLSITKSNCVINKVKLW